MKKILGLLVGLMGLAVMDAGAVTKESVQAVSAKVPYLTSCTGASISSGTATAVVTNTAATRTSPPTYALYVENEDASATIYCNGLTTVATSGSLRGKKILAGSWASWVIHFEQNWYCINDSGAAVNAMVCKSQ